MSIMRYKQILFFCLLSGLIFTACKSRQQMVFSTSPVEEKANNQLFSDIMTSEFQYSTFSAKLNMNLTNGTKSLSSRANIRIVKNSALQISIQPLFGVEMFRFYINPDTVMVVDRMNKRYVMEPIASLKEIYPVGSIFIPCSRCSPMHFLVSGKERPELPDYRKFRFTRDSRSKLLHDLQRCRIGYRLFFYG